MGFEDPSWPRASQWLAQGAPGGLSVIGVPLHRSITPGQCNLAPESIRKALYRYSTYDLDSRTDVAQVPVHDLGDLPLAEMAPEQALDPIAQAVQGALGRSRAVVLLGGDNGVTRPGVHGLGVPLNRCGVVTLDAHFDLRSTADGLHNGNPIRALLEDGLPGRNIVQIGLQPFANSAEYARVAEEAGITFHTAFESMRSGFALLVEQEVKQLAARVDAIYLDVDIDVLDRAFTPGTPGARPGGIAPHELRRAVFMAAKHPKVRAMDLVEIDPTTDTNDLSSLAAAACLLSFASGFAQRK